MLAEYRAAKEQQKGDQLKIKQLRRGRGGACSKPSG
jgi:hypothetical protein